MKYLIFLFIAACTAAKSDNGLPHNISTFETSNRFGHVINCYVLHNEANYNKAISISCVR